MALLLAIYQKMMLIREKNQLVLDQTKVSSKLTRVQKNIERVQKRYTSLFANLDSQAKMMQSQAKMGIQNMFGLGQNSVDIFSSYSGISQFVLNGAMQLCKTGTALAKDSDGNAYATANLSPEKFQEMYRIYMQNGGTFPVKYKEENGVKTPEKTTLEDYFGPDQEVPVYDGNFTAADVQLFQMAMQRAQEQQKVAQWQCNQMSQQYDTNVSIWLDAQKAALEAEQDQMLEPLNYEETMLELEKEQKDTRLQRINEEIETYKQLVSQEVKNTTPTFGLG